MANEFKLSFTANEINEKLSKVDDINDAVKYTEQTLTDAQKAQARANIGAAAIGEGGSGGASSWEELTDRPFGSTYEEGAIILPEAEYTPELFESGEYVVVIDGSAVTSVPKILVVTIDGARYTLSADEESIAYDIGIYEHQDFAVAIILGKGGFITFPTEDTHTISIYECIETITQLDTKYLSAIPADKLPTIPADKLPTIPADKLPAEMEWYASTEYTEKVIIAERPITPSVLETGVGYLSANLQEMHDIIAGAEVVVSHRGKKIVVVAEEWHDGSVIIGNKYLIDTINPDNGMTFCVVLNELDYVIYDRYTTTALFSLSACVRNTIPVKYLPNIPSYKLDETLISWNNIADKPFYSEQFYFGSARRATEADGGSAADIPHILIWDGNTTGLTKVSNWYYVSTCVPSVEELLDTVTVYVHNGVGGSIVSEPVTNIGNASFILNRVIVARKDNIRWSDYVFPKAGIYVHSDVRGVMIPNYIFPENREVTKKIDEKYLPGAVILYRNNSESGNTDPYLYKKNAGNESDRLTSVELHQFVNSGRTIYVDVNGILLTPVQISRGEFARVTIFTGTTDSLTKDYYTAEYTPAT